MKWWFKEFWDLANISTKELWACWQLPSFLFGWLGPGLFKEGAGAKEQPTTSKNVVPSFGCSWYLNCHSRLLEASGEFSEKIDRCKWIHLLKCRWEQWWSTRISPSCSLQYNWWSNSQYFGFYAHCCCLQEDQWNAVKDHQNSKWTGWLVQSEEISKWRNFKVKKFQSEESSKWRFETLLNRQ